MDKLSPEEYKTRSAAWEKAKKNADVIGLGLYHAYAEPCPAKCGRDRFDHEILNNPCPPYQAYLDEKAQEEAAKKTANS